MRDPFPIAAPESLIRLVQPVSHALNLPTLPLHFHEALFAFALYTTICCVVSPILSRIFAPRTYARLNRRTRINWDVHVVSFFQSVLISAFSLYVIFYDEDRKQLRARDRWDARIWEYTGLSGLAQSFALGYFMWDFIMCVWHVKIFGWGMVAHAVSALSVFSFGYRPFVYYYAPVFLLYELSSPFLNIHWFCDKLDLTGSTIQAVNGALLTGTFFGCRLVWGNISSVLVFYDIFRGVRYGNSYVNALNVGAPKQYSAAELLAIAQDEQGQRHAFMGEEYVPLWLAVVYLASNLTLNSLNVFWFGKMIQTIRTRFDPPWGTKGVGPDKIHWEPQEKIAKVAKEMADAIGGGLAETTPDGGVEKKQGSVKAARQKAEAALNTSIPLNGNATAQRATFADGSKSIEVQGARTVRSRRA